MTADYPIFEQWYKTNAWILDRCERMPKSTRFAISGRIMALSLTVMEQIIEAVYTKERQPILRSMNMNLEKLRIFFRLCHDKHYISTAQYQFISTELQTVGKMCGGWMKN